MIILTVLSCSQESDYCVLAAHRKENISVFLKSKFGEHNPCSHGVLLFSKQHDRTMLLVLTQPAFTHLNWTISGNTRTLREI